jgi:hypothetical protein
MTSTAAANGAADLKFLHRLRQIRTRNFKSISGTKKFFLASAPLSPKFVRWGRQ